MSNLPPLPLRPIQRAPHPAPAAIGDTDFARRVGILSRQRMRQPRRTEPGIKILPMGLAHPIDLRGERRHQVFREYRPPVPAPLP